MSRVRYVGDMSCGRNQVFVKGCGKEDGTRVRSYCRDMTEKEINDTEGMSLKEREKHGIQDLSGQLEGTGPDPLEAINSILRDMDLPYNGGGEIEYFNDNGESLGTSQEKAEKERKVNFSTTVTKNGKLYGITGTLTKKSTGRWFASGESEEITFD